MSLIKTPQNGDLLPSLLSNFFDNDKISTNGWFEREFNHTLPALNIKENANLDSLEESDSEDEFENDRVDKFVYLDREYTMTCAYNHKFKKWVPLRVVGK